MKFFAFLTTFLFAVNSFAFEKDKLPGTINKMLYDKYSNVKAESGLSADLVYDLKVNNKFQSTDQKDEFKDTRSIGRAFLRYNFNKNFSLNSTLRLQRYDSSLETTRRSQLDNGGGDRSFENEALFIRELNLMYSHKNYSAIFGKFDLNFGKAWIWNRGISNNEIAKNYRQREKIGFNDFIALGDLKTTGLYQFGFAFFKNDRKYLDNSIITKRDNDAKSAGAAGDAGFFESYIASLDINFDFGELEKLSYHFSYLNLAVDEKHTTIASNKVDDQKNFALSMNYQKPISNDIVLDSLVEFVNVTNYQGNSDISEKYLSANMVARIFDKFNITGGYSIRQNIVVNSSGFDESLTEFSVGYDFAKSKIFDKLTIQVGYISQRNDFKTSLETKNSYALLLRYQKGF